MTIKNLNLKDLGLKLFFAFICICPVFFDPYKSAGLRLHQEQFFQLGAVILFAVVFLESIHLALFLFWSIFIYAYYGFPPIGGAYVMNIFFGCLLYQVAYKLIDRDNLRSFYRAILWLCVLNIVWMIFQKLNIDPIFMNKGEYSKDLVGLFGLKAFMGMFLALSIPFVARLNIWLPLAFFVPIYLSDCSVAVVAGAASYLFALFFDYKKMFWSFLIVLLVGGCFYVAKDTKNGMFTDRFSVWLVSTRDAFKHPIVGWGLDSFRNMGEVKPFIYMKNVRTNESRAVSIKEIQVYKESGVFPPMGDFIKDNDTLNPWDHPHNEYVSLLYEFGLIGVLIFVCLCVDLFKGFYPNDDLIALMGFFIGVLIISTGQFPFHVARIGYLIPIVLGIYKKLTDENEREIYGT